MKKHCLYQLLLTIFIFIIISPVLKSQTFHMSGIKENALKVVEDSYFKTGFESKLAQFKLSPLHTEKGVFLELDIDKFSKTYELGRPQLPSRNEMIEVPHGADFKIKVVNYDYQDFDLGAKGISFKLVPAQPSYSKSTATADMVFHYDEQFYTIDNFYQEPLVSVEAAGIIRGVRMAHLKVSPFAYNPARNILRVYKSINFEVEYENPQTVVTNELKAKYYSPLFDAVHARLLNFKPLAEKGYLSSYPIKYVIVSDPMFETVLQPFVAWKTKKGFEVIEAYTNNPQVGATTTSIKSYLEGLYHAASPGNPAPSYVLFVGDVAQIPTFAGTAGTHPTDLYYCEYDGGNDYLPELYYGRFSATNTTQLQAQIDKTLLYEQYTISHTNYLDTAVLVAGDDNNYAMVHANGQINYATDNYVNASNGVYSYTYLYPASSSSGPQIRADIYKGVGFANYTAHCNYNGWGGPTFTNTNVPNMAEGKFALIISNCCLPNKFNEPECFGEALLRAPNKGAIGHIGASNNTYWDEDYWFAVGYTSNIVQNPTYQGTGLGAYDRLYHTHGEPEQEWFVTNSQIIYAGNMAVELSNTSRKKYYWEAYHLMGDPSVMSFLHKPLPLSATYNNPILAGESSLTITTAPYAYAAISHNNMLLGAAKADSNGLVTLHFTPFFQPDTADIVVTKQNKQPFIGKLYIVTPQFQNDAAVAQIIEPQNQYTCTGISISPKVVVRNMGLANLTSFNIKYRINSGNLINYDWTGSIPSLGTDTIALQAFNLTSGNHQIRVYVSLPNNAIDENHNNDTLVKNFVVQNLPVQALFIPSDTMFCNTPATVSFINQSINASSYLWDFGDGFTSSATSPVHVYQNIGSYTVSLVADAGICGTQTYQLPYSLNIGLSAPLADNQESCGPGSFTLSASGYNSINWFLSPQDSLPIHTGSSLNIPYLDTTTTYYVQGYISQPPQSAGKIDNSGSGGYFNNATNWHYQIFNTFEPVKIVSVKVYASGAGNRDILLRNSSGQTLDSVNVYVPDGESRITLNMDVPVGNNFQLVGRGAVNLYRNNNNAATYPYELPGILSITETSASLPPYNTYGNYYYFYEWEVKPQECYSVFKPVTAYVLDLPQSQFLHSISGYTVNFTNLSPYAMSNYWDFGDGQTSTDASPSHTYAVPGNYDVKLHVANICGADSTEMQIVLQGMAPQVDFLANQTNLLTGDSVSFTDLSLFSPDSWSWIFEGGTPSTSNIQNPTVVYNSPGIFYVTLIATNTYGNGFEHKTQYIHVDPSSVNSLTGLITPMVLIYPNPVSDSYLFVKLSGYQGRTLIGIYDVLGKEVFVNSFIVGNDIIPVNVSALKSGVYLLHVTDNTHSQTLKFFREVL